MGVIKQDPNAPSAPTDQHQRDLQHAAARTQPHANAVQNSNTNPSGTPADDAQSQIRAALASLGDEQARLQALRSAAQAVGIDLASLAKDPQLQNPPVQR